MERIKARRSCSKVIQILKGHTLQPRLLYPAELSITIDGVNKIFHDKTRFKQYLSINPALQKALERNSNLRKPYTPMKPKTINNPTKEKPKKGKYTQATTKNNRK